MDRLRLLANIAGTRDFDESDPLHVQELINKFIESGGVIETTEFSATGTFLAEAAIIQNGNKVRTTVQAPTYSEAVISVILKLL